MKRFLQQNEHNIRIGTLNSLFGEASSLFMGVINCVIATLLCYSTSLDTNFILIGFAFLFVGLVRVFISKRYHALDHSEFSPHDLYRWENLCISSGTFTAAILGFFSFYALVFTTDGFAQLTAVTVAIANTVGIAGRNFGSKKYVLLQSIMIGVPLIGGLVLYADVIHWGLAALYVTHMLAIVVMATNLRDVLHTALRREAEVTRIADDLGIALETMPNGLIMFDDQDRLKLSNDEAKKILLLNGHKGLTVDQVLDRLRELFSLDGPTIQQMKRSFDLAKRGAKVPALTLRYGAGQAYKIRMKSNTEGSLVVRIDDITVEERANAQIVAMARYDSLTGLANRAWFFEQAHQIRRQLKPGQVLLLAAIDLDDFKTINDTHGHPMGDKLLVHVAQQLDSAVRAHDICARFGGDEFMVIMVLEEYSSSSISGVANSLAQRVNQSILFDGIALKLAASIGIAVQDSQDTSIDELLIQADHALYSAKKDPLVQTCVFEEQMRIEMLRQQSVKTELKVAIEQGTLSTMFQPIVDAKTGAILDFEALARWVHPELGVIGPDEFIPIAEDIGVIGDITRQQLMTACMACAKLRDPIGVSVNLSALDFRTNKLIDSIKTALITSGLHPSRLSVEVTETSLLDLRPETLSMLNEIRSLGVLVALDDFGVGYSSLSYLHKLPLDRLKIDRSFVMQIDESKKTLKLLSAIGKMAEDLGMEVVVEGIETHDQMQTIQSHMNASYFQGYLFAAPMLESSLLTYCSHAVPFEPATISNAKQVGSMG